MDHLDALVAAPFPAEGHHLVVLRAGQDFWDAGLDAVEAADEEMEAALQELAAALTTRWGPPEKIDLAPYLEAETPEPITTLCMVAGSMLVWRRPEAGRWVALTVGQADREFPIELIAVVSDVPLGQRREG